MGNREVLVPRRPLAVSERAPLTRLGYVAHADAAGVEPARPLRLARVQTGLPSASRIAHPCAELGGSRTHKAASMRSPAFGTGAVGSSASSLQHAESGRFELPRRSSRPAPLSRRCPSCHADTLHARKASRIERPRDSRPDLRLATACLRERLQYRTAPCDLGHLHRPMLTSPRRPTWPVRDVVYVCRRRGTPRWRAPPCSVDCSHRVPIGCTRVLVGPLPANFFADVTFASIRTDYYGLLESLCLETLSFYRTSAFKSIESRLTEAERVGFEPTDGYASLVRRAPDNRSGPPLHDHIRPFQRAPASRRDSDPHALADTDS